MKLIKVLSLFGAAIVPQLALANAVLPSGLGQTKAIYDYCSKVDPADAATFGKMWSNAAEGKTSLAPASGFQVIYDSTISKLKALPKSDIVSGCHGGASQWTRADVEAHKLRARPIFGKAERPG
jgi:hypothetical protein